MSYINFEKALRLAKNCDKYETLGNVTDEKILEAQDLLNIVFSRQHYEYYKKVGILSYYGSEYYGISNRNFTGLPGSNAVLLALNDRQEFNLDKNLVPIYFFDDGLLAYLDYNSLNIYSEPAIVTEFYNGDKYIKEEILAEDLGDFILGLVDEQLKIQ